MPRNRTELERDHDRRKLSLRRSFCSRCGSNLLFEPNATPDVAWVAVGGFDSDPKERPGTHIYVASKAPWFEISDELPQFSEGAGDSW